MTGINEERGARRAAALKKRFRKVSNRSFGRTGVSRTRDPSMTDSAINSGSFGRNVLIWAAIGVAAYVLGTFLT